MTTPDPTPFENPAAVSADDAPEAPGVSEAPEVFGPSDDVGAPARRRFGFGMLLRYGFLVVVLALATWQVYENWDQMGQAFDRVTVGPLIGALLLAAAGAWSGVPAWRDLLAGLGSRLSRHQTQRVFLMGQLGKYIPGGVWTVLAQATLAKELHVPRARSATASLMAVLLAVVTGSGIGAIALLVAGRQLLGARGWILLLVLPLLVFLHPDVLVWAGKLAGRLTGREVALERLPAKTLLSAAGWLAAGQVVSGLSLYLLVGMIGGHYPNPLLPIGVSAFASAAGILVIFAPAGVGAREAILVLGLSGAAGGAAPALLVALLSRVLLTVVDFGLAAGAAAFARRATRRAAAVPARTAENEGN